jgi:hypothetical protein
VPGRRGRPGERRVLHAWLPPERTSWRPPCRRRRGGVAPWPGRAKLPPIQKSGLRVPFFHSLPGIRCWRGRGTRLLRGLRCACGGPDLYLGRFPPGPGRARPPRGCRGAGAGLCSRPAPGAVCSRGSAGDGSTGIGKAWQRTGTGSSAMGRPVPGQPAHPVRGGTARCRSGGPPTGFPEQGPGTVRRTGRPFSQARQPVVIPHRQLICQLIRIPADSGMPWLR